MTGRGYTYITTELNILRIKARTKEYLLKRYSHNIPTSIELDKIEYTKTYLAVKPGDGTVVVVLVL